MASGCASFDLGMKIEPDFLTEALELAQQTPLLRLFPLDSAISSRIVGLDVSSAPGLVSGVLGAQWEPAWSAWASVDPAWGPLCLLGRGSCSRVVFFFLSPPSLPFPSLILPYSTGMFMHWARMFWLVCFVAVSLFVLEAVLPPGAASLLGCLEALRVLFTIRRWHLLSLLGAFSAPVLRYCSSWCVCCTLFEWHFSIWVMSALLRGMEGCGLC